MILTTDPFIKTHEKNLRVLFSSTAFGWWAFSKFGVWESMFPMFSTDRIHPHTYEVSHRIVTKAFKRIKDV